MARQPITLKTLVVEYTRLCDELKKKLRVGKITYMDAQRSYESINNLFIHYDAPLLLCITDETTYLTINFEINDLLNILNFYKAHGL